MADLARYRVGVVNGCRQHGCLLMPPSAPAYCGVDGASSDESNLRYCASASTWR